MFGKCNFFLKSYIESTSYIVKLCGLIKNNDNDDVNVIYALYLGLESNRARNFPSLMGNYVQKS